MKVDHHLYLDWYPSYRFRIAGRSGLKGIILGVPDTGCSSLSIPLPNFQHNPCHHSHSYQSKRLHPFPFCFPYSPLPHSSPPQHRNLHFLAPLTSCSAKSTHFHIFTCQKPGADRTTEVLIDLESIQLKISFAETSVVERQSKEDRECRCAMRHRLCLDSQPSSSQSKKHNPARFVAPS